ncbi:MAG: leucine-rich repeat domain-containing protein [Promethearchaeota archaeon]
MSNGFVTFQGKTYHIKNNELELRFKKIRTFTEIIGLERLSNLQKLILDHNKIREIKGLDHLKNLKELDLRYNEITEIKGLEHLINLQELHLSGNPIRTDEEYLVKKHAQEVVRYCQNKVKPVSERATTPAIKQPMTMPVESTVSPFKEGSIGSSINKVCQSCGLSIEEGTIFCPHCGAEI